MRILLSVLSLVGVLAVPVQAQVNATVRDTALRSFLGVRSIGSTVPIAPPAAWGFATVLVFKDGKFWKRIADTSILLGFSQKPIAVGKPEAGYAPAALQAEFLWGPRDGKVGYVYMVQTSGDSLVAVPRYEEMPELASLNTTLTNVATDPSFPKFRGMILLGAAYEVSRAVQGEDVEDYIKASDLAVVAVYQSFQSEEERTEFMKGLDGLARD